MFGFVLVLFSQLRKTKKTPACLFCIFLYVFVHVVVYVWRCLLVCVSSYLCLFQKRLISWLRVVVACCCTCYLEYFVVLLWGFDWLSWILLDASFFSNFVFNFVSNFVFFNFVFLILFLFSYYSFVLRLSYCFFLIYFFHFSICVFYLFICSVF